MEKVELNKDMKLSEHFKLGELTKTSCKTKDGNIPSRVAIENLRNLCENWLEDLRYSYNTLYHKGGIVINSGYRSPEVNRLAGGSPTSNHLTGCAVDIHVTGFEQAIRYAAPNAISMNSSSRKTVQAITGSTSPSDRRATDGRGGSLRFKQQFPPFTMSGGNVTHNLDNNFFF